MKISLNWLKDFVEISEEPEEIAKRLTLSTSEVEDVYDLKKQFEGVFVARVVSIEKHPNADKLFVVTVDMGDGPVRVVCGASNVEVGQLVSFATVGTTLPNGLTLEKIKIRGVVSSGMICAEDELGMGDDHDGILVLDDAAIVGMSFAEYVGVDDIVFEIDNKSITHRPDLFSHIGIAREIAALYERDFKEPDLVEVTGGDTDMLSVEIEDENKCSRYIGLVLDGIRMNPTPDYIVKRLEATGMRSINVVVDIANYVMLEWGQPLHTFDFETLEGDSKKIEIRDAKEGEKMVTIEGKELELTSDDLIITDGKSPIALAGVMGAGTTEVGEGTTKIVLEVAHFDGPTVRRASRRHGIRSEALLRFEKGLPVELPSYALRKTVELLKEYAVAQVSSVVVDEYPRKFKEKKIELSPEYMTRVLGFLIENEEIEKCLESLGFIVESVDDYFVVTVPWFREGMELEEELIEEVGRLKGADSIEPQPFSDLVRPVPKNPDFALQRKIKELLAAQGLDEIYTYSFYGERLLKKAGMNSDKHIELEEPLSRDLAFMRRSLLPYHLEKMEMNVHNFDDAAFFEVGHVYEMDEEYTRVSGVLFGIKKEIFYKAKGIMEAVFDELNIGYDAEETTKTDTFFVSALFDSSALLHITADDKKLGAVALVDPKIQKNFSIKNGYVAVFDFDLREIIKYSGVLPVFSDISEFPEATVDLAFVMKNTIPLASLERVIKKESGELLKQMKVFDIYRGKPLLEDEKSVAFHLTYQSNERTLKDEEVKDIRARIEKHLEKEFDARIRDF